MSSSLYTAIENLFMLNLFWRRLNNPQLKPTLWKRDVYDLFIIWPHRKPPLQDVLTHLNNIYNRIEFTLEVENKRQLPLQDLLSTRKLTGNLGHTLYWNATANKHHHPPQNQTALNTLVCISFLLTEPGNWKREQEIITKALSNNGNETTTINKAIEKPDTNKNNRQPNRKPSHFLKYNIKGDKISRILRKQNFKKTNNYIIAIAKTKNKIPFESPDVYSIPCSACKQQYMEQLIGEYQWGSYSIKKLWKQNEHLQPYSCTTTTKNTK